MLKKVKIGVTCPNCAAKVPLGITEDLLGKTVQGVCPSCHGKAKWKIPMSLASMFNTDPTFVPDAGKDRSLVLEVLPNEFGSNQSFELTSDYYTIGRQNNGGPEHRPDVAVVTADKLMSRIHAGIRKKFTGFTLKDLGSKNGITLNGEPIEKDSEVYLNDGDKFTLGKTQFCVSILEQSVKDDDLTK